MNKSSIPHQAADTIRKLAPNFTPKLALVLGSGLGKLAEALEDSLVIPYEKLPGFPRLSVEGHSNALTLGILGGTPVICLQGRSHTYETLSYDAVKNYVRTMKLLGCEYYLATNASGSLREDVGPGSLVMIRDHINFQPGNPLAGPNDEEFGPRFPALDKVYDADMRATLKDCAQTLDLPLKEGVYISVLGPSYETAAEIRAFKMWGAEVIGMSTVPEVIVAHHCGLRVAVVATITNYATGLTPRSHDHNEVVKAAEAASGKLIRLLKAFVGAV